MVLRSGLLTALVGRGAIASIALGAQEVSPRLERWGGRIVVSAVNGPASSAVAGDGEALQELLAELEGEGVRARIVPGTVATHSAQAESLREELLEVCAGIAPVSGDVPFFSTVTATLLDTAGLDGEYWYRNLREPVQLDGVVRALLEQGQRAFLEVSAHPVLTVGVQATVDELLPAPQEALIAGSLRRGEGGLQRFLKSLGEVWVRGAGGDWGVVFSGSPARQVQLPTYAFQRERYWLDVRVGEGVSPATMVGSPLSQAAPEGEQGTLVQLLAEAHESERRASSSNWCVLRLPSSSGSPPPRRSILNARSRILASPL